MGTGPFIASVMAAVLVLSAASTVVATTPPPGFALQETITVPVNGDSISSTTTLQSGVSYKIRASGTFTISPSSCPLADAEFARFEVGNTCALPGTPQDTVGPYDIGIGINTATSSNSKGVTWSATFDPTHEYTVDFVGLGATISLNYHDGFYVDNSGSLTVEIFAPVQAAAVPTLSEWAQLLLLALLVGGALWSVRGRARRPASVA